MATLLLRLAAPIQAWGDESKYDIRQTCREPSKSAVIGLLGAALGLRRDSYKIPEISAALRMGIRVEMPGQVIHDFHTARAPKYTNKREVRHEKDGAILMEDSPYVTHRYYLCDACFLVGLESENETLIQQLQEAIVSPAFPLYLGRRSCPPTQPLLVGLRSGNLEDVLKREPWQAPEWYKRKYPSSHLRIIMETPKGASAWHQLRDEPVSFNPLHRRYAPRGVEKERYVMVNAMEHDPMKEL